MPDCLISRTSCAEAGDPGRQLQNSCARRGETTQRFLLRNIVFAFENSTFNLSLTLLVTHCRSTVREVSLSTQTVLAHYFGVNVNHLLVLLEIAPDYEVTPTFEGL